jgi:hypothetical protein
MTFCWQFAWGFPICELPIHKRSLGTATCISSVWSCRMSSAPREARRVIGSALGVLDDWRQFAQGCRANLLIVGELAATAREDILAGC